jgi:hypothetical protein
MTYRMVRFLRVVLLAMVVAPPLWGDYLELSRSANLKEKPEASSNSIAKLDAHARLILVQPDQENGFYHVRVPGTGETGWVYRTLGRRFAGLPEGTSEPTPPTTGGDTSSGTSRVGPARLYPDPALTPGFADTLLALDLTKQYTEHCPSNKASCTYSQAHRNVPRSVHNQVYDEYNVPQAKRNIDNGEVDHFQPLCAGGSNDIKNLWYQPVTNDWKGEDFGFHAKDKLETYICAQIKAGKLDPKEAYKRMTEDWVKFYLDEGLDDDEN